MEYRINLTDDTVEKLGTVLGEPIQELEQEILDKEQEIEELEAEIDAFPDIEQLNVTQNGTFSEEGKAYSPVVVNVPQTTVEPLSVTQNGTYSEEGKAYSPVTVDVSAAPPYKAIQLTFVNPNGRYVYDYDVQFFSNLIDGGRVPRVISVEAFNDANANKAYNLPSVPMSKAGYTQNRFFKIMIAAPLADVTIEKTQAAITANISISKTGKLNDTHTQITVGVPNNYVIDFPVVNVGTITIA